jgi:hypothetical protein
MNEIERARRLERLTGRRHAGLLPGDAIVFGVEALAVQMLDRAPDLPEETDTETIQGPGGGFGFMMGVSPLGGGEPLP